MCAFIDFARLAAALRCCRNVVSIGRLGMLRLAVATAVTLAAFSFVAEEAVAQVSDAEIARAVRLARSSQIPPPAMPAAQLVFEDQGSRVQTVLRILNQTGTKDGDLIARINDEILRQDAIENLFGFKFGVGLSVTTSRRKGEIKDAVVDSNRVVRVTREQDSSIGYLLEAHYFFVPNRPFLSAEVGSWGIGPFVAIQAGTGSGSALSGLGFGLMLGFRQPNTAPIANLSWNFGIGAIYDPSVKVLGSGIVADRPLPAGETMLRTTEVGSWGLMLMSSFNF